VKLVLHLNDFGWPIAPTAIGGMYRIERTCAYQFDVDDGGPLTATLIDGLQHLADAGIDTVIGRVPGLERRTPLEHLVRHVVPAANEMTGR
jgi:hypothetical protein